MGHTLLKKAILHLKRANGRFILQGTVALFLQFSSGQILRSLEIINRWRQVKTEDEGL